MKIGCQDVARAAGVSPTTVSLVLNRRMDVSISEATRQRVLAVAEELGYRPNLLAKGLLRGRTRTIGVMLPSLASSFVAQIAEGIQSAAGDEDYRVLLGHTRHEAEFEGRQLELLIQHQVDGVIILAGEKTLKHLGGRLGTLAKAGIPCVVVDDRTWAAEVDCVVSDDEDGARQAVTHLLELGHRRIAFLGAGDLTSSARDRLRGYQLALKGAGVEFDPGLVAGSSFLGGDGFHAATTLLSQPRRPTALFAANDRRLAEALPVLEQLELQVPRDLSLVGYANYDFAAYLGFSSMDQQPVELGRVALFRLLERLDRPGLRPKILRLPTRLVARSSSAPPRSSA